MKNITKAAFVITLLAGLLLVPAGVVHADAGQVFNEACSASNNNPAVCGGNNTGIFGVIKIVINVLLMIAGTIAVIMIIVGGIKYVTSSGDQAHVKSAKDTILYSVIGLAVTILSFAIVNYVIGKL